MNDYQFDEPTLHLARDIMQLMEIARLEIELAQRWGENNRSKA